MTKTNANLFVAQVAEIAGCHPNTVRRYENRGVLCPKRDMNGYRRYTIKQALELKNALAKRIDRKPEKHFRASDRP